MTAQDYPVTNPYKPPSHNGRDRGMPIGTPVEVAGVVIGLSGNTGLSTGPHLHTQSGTDPGCQKVIDPTPYEFQPGTVTATGTGSQWGKYITMQVGDKYITYAHLSQINVTIGQKIGDNMPDFKELAVRRQEMLQGIAKLVIPGFKDEVDGNNYPQVVANIAQLYKNNDALTKLAEDRLVRIRELESSNVAPTQEQIVGGELVIALRKALPM